MKIASTLKTLALTGVASLTFAAAASQADTGYIYFGSGNGPWAGGQANPWMANPGLHRARFQEEMKQRHQALDQRQDAQMERILRNMEKGRLTSNEAASLLREHLAIAQLERNYIADGRLGPRELGDLEVRLADAGRRIVAESRDREVAATIERDGPARRYEDRPGYGYRDDDRR